MILCGVLAHSTSVFALQITRNAIAATQHAACFTVPSAVSNFASASGGESQPANLKGRPAKQSAAGGTSRKPAILRPSLHQWRLCSPLYDPAVSPPRQHLPPYAPERAQKKDYRAMMLASKPVSFHRNKHRRNWDQLMKNACHTWRRKAEQRAADAAKRTEYRTAVDKHVAREKAWMLWCSQNVSPPQLSH